MDLLRLALKKICAVQELHFDRTSDSEALRDRPLSEHFHRWWFPLRHIPRVEKFRCSKHSVSLFLETSSCTIRSGATWLGYVSWLLNSGALISSRSLSLSFSLQNNQRVWWLRRFYVLRKRGGQICCAFISYIPSLSFSMCLFFHLSCLLFLSLLPSLPMLFHRNSVTPKSYQCVSSEQLYVLRNYWCDRSVLLPKHRAITVDDGFVGKKLAKYNSSWLDLGAGKVLCRLVIQSSFSSLSLFKALLIAFVSLSLILSVFVGRAPPGDGEL